ncbi:fasciclin-like arabinogalactan protein 14 [Fagus crenata]
MNSKASSLLFFALFLVFTSAASAAFNITKLLGNFPEFSTLNDYLTKTQLYQQINSRNTITVLAVDNKAIASLSGSSLDEIKKILSVHVVLDYYDVQKLSTLSKKTTLLTTLFQSSGVAVNQQGFVNVSLVNEGEIAFGSAVKGASLNSKLVKSVAAQPYNISVLQITSPIVPPGITMNQAATPKSSPPPKAATPVAAPKKSPPAKAPVAHAPSKKPVPEAPTPSGEEVVDTPEASPSLAPEADAPVADSPVDDASPVGSPAADAADAPAPTTKSGSSRTSVASGVLLVGLMGLLALFL